jgi:hypothetical protein
MLCIGVRATRMRGDSEAEGGTYELCHSLIVIAFGRRFQRVKRREELIAQRLPARVTVGNVQRVGEESERDFRAGRD